MLELKNIQIFGLDTVDKLRNEIRLSLKMSLRSFPRDKTCPRANGDVIVSPFKFYAPLSCHSRQGSKIAFSFIVNKLITNQGLTPRHNTRHNTRHKTPKTKTHQDPRPQIFSKGAGKLLPFLDKQGEIKKADEQFITNIIQTAKENGVDEFTLKFDKSQLMGLDTTIKKVKRNVGFDLDIGIKGETNVELHIKFKYP